MMFIITQHNQEYCKLAQLFTPGF